MPIARRQLVVLARWPAPGRCKRRLAASCGSRQAAAAVQRRLTWHTVAAAAAAGADELSIAVDGLGRRARRRWGRQLQHLHRAQPLRLVPQGHGSLGSRMQALLLDRFRRGAEQVVLVGTDLPGLEAGDLRTAFSCLDHHPLVMGPAEDGGYWLLGLNRDGFNTAGSQLMSGIPWGSDQVLQHTLARAAGVQLPVRLLRRQSDLDTAHDLAPWLRMPTDPR